MNAAVVERVMQGGGVARVLKGIVNEKQPRVVTARGVYNGILVLSLN